MRKTETRVSSTADDTDLQILSLLQGNARMSIKHIAEKPSFLPPRSRPASKDWKRTDISQGIIRISIRRRLGSTLKRLSIWRWSPYRKKNFILISVPVST